MAPTVPVPANLTHAYPAKTEACASSSSGAALAVHSPISASSAVESDGFSNSANMAAVTCVKRWAFQVVTLCLILCVCVFCARFDVSST